MPITDRAQVQPGVTLIGKLKGVEYACKVKDGEDGLTFNLTKAQVPEGTALSYKTPSGAASACMGGIAANGWRFWSIKGGEQDPAEFAKANPGATDRLKAKADAKAEAKAAEPKERKPRTPRKRAPHKIIKQASSQADVPEGAVRWFCDACMTGFVAIAAEANPACPNGHTNDDPAFANLNDGIAADADTEVA